MQYDQNLVVHIVHEGTIISRAQNNVGGHYVTSTGTAIIPMEIGQKVSDTQSPTEYQKRTGQFLRALHVYSIDNFVAF